MGQERGVSMNTFSRLSLAVVTVLVLFACQRTPTPPASTLRLVIEADLQTYSQAGQSINYTYVITNTGTAALGPAQFMIRGDRLTGPFSCGPANTTLAPNQNLTCSAVYTITQADMSLAVLTNSAIASGAGQTSPAASVSITNLNNQSLTSTPTATLAVVGTLPTAATPVPDGTPVGTADLTQVPPIRIDFGPGQTTSAVIGILNPGQTIRYGLRAAAGQTLSIQLTAAANEISLGVNDPAGAVLKPADTTLTWSTAISIGGDYTISLVSLAANSSTSYTLEVRLEAAP
jgi:hypothetical protein